MIKTQIDIERDFFGMITQAVGRDLRGKVYRAEMRPDNARTEDAVVKLLAARDDQIQTGTVILNVYIPDITLAGGRSVANTERIATIERLIVDYIDGGPSSEYHLETDGSPMAIAIEGTAQHVVTARINYKRLTH